MKKEAIEKCRQNAEQLDLIADGPALVIGYCRLGRDDVPDDEFAVQEAAIEKDCAEYFGGRPYMIAWVLDRGSGSLPYYRPGLEEGQYRQGLGFALGIIRSGQAKYLAVHRLSNLTRDMRLYFEIQEKFIEPNGAEILVANQPKEVSSAIESISELLKQFPKNCNGRKRDSK